MAKEGLSVFLSAILFSLIILLGILFTGGVVLKVLFIFSIFMIAFTVFFFRNPKRKVPAGDNLILSPADGKVILIQEAEENEFFNSKAIQISIFLSIFDVHINRIPLEGKVTFFNYSRGKFHPAFREIASYENEQTAIGIENEGMKVLLKQIAGIIARRIVCYPREGWHVKLGERFGMIKFGSRVDIFLPKNVTLDVQLKDKVKAGETILGSY